jgi:hypothetical protein
MGHLCWAAKSAVIHSVAGIYKLFDNRKNPNSFTASQFLEWINYEMFLYSHNIKFAKYFAGCSYNFQKILY